MRRYRRWLRAHSGIESTGSCDSHSAAMTGMPVVTGSYDSFAFSDRSLVL